MLFSAVKMILTESLGDENTCMDYKAEGVKRLEICESTTLS